MIDMVLMTVVWPAIAGAVVLLIGLAAQMTMTRVDGSRQQPGLAEQPAQPAPWPVMLAGAIGITAAFVISFRNTEGQWPLPPHTSWQWVFLMAIAAGLVGSINSLVPGRWMLPVPRIVIAGVVLGIVGAILLRPLPPIEGDSAAWPDWVWKIGFGLVVLTLWLGLETVARREHAGWTLFGVIAAFTAASLVIVEARFAKPSQLAGAVAATCGIAMALGIILPMLGRKMPVHCGMTAPLAMILPALLIFGWFYNSSAVPATSFVLAGVTPLALLFTAMPPMRQWGGWRGWALRFALIVVLPAIAIALTMMREVPPEPAGYEW